MVRCIIIICTCFIYLGCSHVRALLIKSLLFDILWVGYWIFGIDIFGSGPLNHMARIIQRVPSNKKQNMKNYEIQFQNKLNV